MLIPEGYEKIPGTSDMIMPALRPCPHRGEKIVEKSCCGLIKIMFCDLCADRTTRSKCKNCNHLYRLINHRSIQCFHDLLRSTPIINTKGHKMKIHINSCHAALEYDQARLLTEIGCTVTGIFDVGSNQRPKIPGVTDLQWPEEIHDRNKRSNELTLSDLDNPDIILVHQTADFVDRCFNLSKLGKPVIGIVFGQGNMKEHGRMAELMRSTDNIFLIAYALKEFNAYIHLGAPADRLFMIRFSKSRADFDPTAWVGSSRDCFLPCNSVQYRGACNPEAVDLLQSCRSINVVVGGRETEKIGGLGELSFDDYRERLRLSACYLHVGTVPAPYTLTLVEAACAGTPIIAFDNGQGLELEGFLVRTVTTVQAAVYEIKRIMNEDGYRQNRHDHSVWLAETAFNEVRIKNQWRLLLQAAMTT